MFACSYFIHSTSCQYLFMHVHPIGPRACEGVRLHWAHAAKLKPILTFLYVHMQLQYGHMTKQLGTVYMVGIIYLTMNELQIKMFLTLRY